MKKTALCKINPENLSILDSVEDPIFFCDDKELFYINNSLKELKKNYPRLFENFKQTVNYTDFKKLKDSKISLFEEKFLNGKYYRIEKIPIKDKKTEKFCGILVIFKNITSQTNIKIDLFKANRKMLDDILISRKIQQKLMGKDGIYKNLTFESLYEPCDNLSGDIYDILKTDDDKIIFYIADVCGHGVSASIMTMFVKQALTSIVESNRLSDPNCILKKLKDEFVKLGVNRSQYFTIWLGIFDLKKKSLMYSNAGLNSIPVVLSEGKTIYLYSKGRMISNILQDYDYELNCYHLKDGDTFLFYTDGVVECKDVHSNQYGIERLTEKFKENRNVQKIYEDLLNHKWKEIKDDIALAIISYKE